MRLNYGADVSYMIEHPVLQKHVDLLEKFAEKELFAVFYWNYKDENNKKLFLENCNDPYYRLDLTEEICRELAELFAELADEMNKGESNGREN